MKKASESNELSRLVLRIPLPHRVGSKAVIQPNPDWIR